jgi:glutathionylspermidine synthase
VRRVEGGIVRPGWEAEIEAQGLVYNRTEVPGGEVRSYWREGPFYDFTSDEVRRLEGWVAQLFEMCVAAGDHVVEHDLFGRMRIPPMAREQIRRTWDDEPPSVYARFDLRYDGSGPPQLFEFNADTPTGLVESAVTQWNWHLFTGQGQDQWNALHEKLVAAWKRNLLKWERRTGVRPRVHLAWTSEETSGEDRMTVAYLMDTVVQAGYEAIELVVEDIVLDSGDGRFYDQQGRHLDVVFKLYPWEWLLEDAFGTSVIADQARPGGTTWVEPVYKMLWSTKALLPVLWQLFGSDPELSRLLLPAYFADEMPSSWRTYVRKPLWGREGANVSIIRDGDVVEAQPGRYGTEGWIVQEFAPLPDFEGVDGAHHPALGAWVVDGEPAGLGIRESDRLITDNISYFVPHTIDHGVPRAGRRGRS